jgi:hypothetical protein
VLDHGRVHHNIIHLEEAIEWYVPKLTNKTFTTELFDILEMGIPLTTVANTMQLTAVMEGVHSIDIGILVTPIIVEMLAYLADAQGVKYKVGDEEPEDDEIPTEGEIAAALNKLKEEEDKPIPVPGIDNDEGLEEEEEEPKGLMARRA